MATTYAVEPVAAPLEQPCNMGPSFMTNVLTVQQEALWISHGAI